MGPRPNKKKKQTKRVIFDDDAQTSSDDDSDSPKVEEKARARRDQGRDKLYVDKVKMPPLGQDGTAVSPPPHNIAMSLAPRGAKIGNKAIDVLILNVPSNTLQGLDNAIKSPAVVHRSGTEVDIKMPRGKDDMKTLNRGHYNAAKDLKRLGGESESRRMASGVLHRNINKLDPNYILRIQFSGNLRVGAGEVQDDELKYFKGVEGEDELVSGEIINEETTANIVGRDMNGSMPGWGYCLSVKKEPDEVESDSEEEDPVLALSKKQYKRFKQEDGEEWDDSLAAAMKGCNLEESDLDVGKPFFSWNLFLS
jgi:hypothetical protein